MSSTVSSGKLSLLAAAPVHGISLRAMTLELEQRTVDILLVTSAVTALQSSQLRGNVVDADNTLIGPTTDNLRTIGQALVVTSTVEMKLEIENISNSFQPTRIRLIAP